MEISSHSINYNGLNILINLKGNMYIETEYSHEALNILEVIITKDNNQLFLGNFYSQLPKTLFNEELELLVMKIVDDLDIIMFDKYRFIGTFNDGVFEDSEDISEALFNKLFKHDEELNQIYIEFMKMKKDTKEHNKYAHFLELYFNSHSIPDSIKGTYLKKKRSRMLDYEDLDYEIKRDFVGNVYESTGASNYEKNLLELEEIKKELLPMVDELKGLEELLDIIESMISRLDNNKAVKKSINALEQELENSGVFSSKRKELKMRIRELEDKFVKINIKEERRALKEKIHDKYVSINPEFSDVLKLFDTSSLEDIETFIKEIYNTRCDRYNDLRDKYDTVYEKVEYHESNEVDISDLYERLDDSKIKG